jgi:hypothetical protein
MRAPVSANIVGDTVGLVLQLRVIASPKQLADAAEALAHLPGVGSTFTTQTEDPAAAVLWADVAVAAGDEVLHALTHVGVEPEAVMLARLDTVGPLVRRSRSGGADAGFAWVQVLGEARAHARPIGRHLALMGVAGVIAALGVIHRNPILRRSAPSASWR